MSLPALVVYQAQAFAFRAHHDFTSLCWTPIFLDRAANAFWEGYPCLVAALKAWVSFPASIFVGKGGTEFVFVALCTTWVV